MKATATDTGLKSWEHPEKSGIRITPIINRTVNPDGESRTFNASFLVTVPAKLSGAGRKRKQFTTQAAAEKWADDQVKGTRQLGEQFFQVSAQERRDAVTALEVLRPHGVSLSTAAAEYAQARAILQQQGVELLEAVKFALPRMKPSGGDRTVNQVVEEMTVSKENRFRTGQLRDRSLSDFKIRSKRFVSDFGLRLIKELSHEEIKKWILGLGLSARSNKNYLACLGEVFRFARQKKYISATPFEDFADDDLKEMKGNDGERSEPNVLTVEQAERLLSTALAHPELDLLAAVTLGLFCGIRTAELMKLEWRHVNINASNSELSFVTIPKEIAKKRKIRNVTIPISALAWLDRCPRKEGLLADNKYSSDYRKRFLKLQKLAGFGRTEADGKWKSTWEENNMRHSFGTYHFALSGNSMETARLLGHAATDHVLFEHYRALASKEEAQRYFELIPPPNSSAILQLRLGHS